MKVTLLKHWNGFPPGRILDLTDGEITLLERRKIVSTNDTDIEDADTNRHGSKPEQLETPLRNRRRRNVL